MNNTYTLFSKAIVIILLTLFANLNQGFAQDKTEQLDELLGKYLEYGQFNGSALVSINGEVIYKKGFGMANMEWDIPNQANTKHRLGSITKQFTGMIMLQLAQEGKLDLHAPISTYLKDYPAKTGDIITTHHLLTHSSGLPNYTAMPGFFRDESRDPYTPKEFVKYFDDKDLDFEPGAQFSYSNSGYFLLGVIAEELTGKSYEDLLHERIFEPLGMNDTGYDNHGDILKNRATGYEKEGGGYVNSRYLDMSIPYSAGSMYSTVEDLYTWDQALYTYILLDKEHMDLYLTPQIKAGGFGQYAYGWGLGELPIGDSEEKIAAIQHGGGINGFNTTISRSVSDKSLIVLLNNTGGTDLNAMAQGIRGILYDRPYSMPKKSVATATMDKISTDGLQAGIAHFHAIKNNNSYNLDEGDMNNVGYQFMANDQLGEAKAIFKLNVEAFPTSFNVYDSYAEAQMNLGEKELAIENYKKSIALNPANQNGIDMLKKMGEATDDLVAEVVVPEHLLESYIGKYELMPGFIITITKEGTQMRAQATGQGTFDIFPKSENEFYLKAIAARLLFNADDSGKIKSVTLFQGGQEMEGSRMEE